MKKSLQINGIEQASEYNFEQLKKEAIEIMQSAGEGTIEPESLQRRLEYIAQSKEMTQEEMSKYLTPAQQAEYGELGGFCVNEKTDDGFRRFAVIEKQKFKLIQLYVLLHESIHLLGREPFEQKSTVLEEGTERIEYLGPLSRMTEYADGRIVNYHDNEASEISFWDGVTDWLAVELLKAEHSHENIDEIMRDSLSGFPIERVYIECLVSRHPDKEKIINALKEALFSANLYPLYEAFGDNLDETPSGEAFYPALLAIFGELNKAIQAVERETINKTTDKLIKMVDNHYALMRHKNIEDLIE